MFTLSKIRDLGERGYTVIIRKVNHNKDWEVTITNTYDTDPNKPHRWERCQDQQKAVLLGDAVKEAYYTTMTHFEHR